MEWSFGAELWRGVLEWSGVKFWSGLAYGIRKFGGVIMWLWIGFNCFNGFLLLPFA